MHGTRRSSGRQSDECEDAGAEEVLRGGRLRGGEDGPSPAATSVQRPGTEASLAGKAEARMKKKLGRSFPDHRTFIRRASLILDSDPTRLSGSRRREACRQRSCARGPGRSSRCRSSSDGARILRVEGG